MGVVEERGGGGGHGVGGRREGEEEWGCGEKYLNNQNFFIKFYCLSS